MAERNLREGIQSLQTPVFVGRTVEQGWITTWFEQSQRMTNIVGISGGPGVGKSALIELCMDLASQYSANKLWLDGRLCPKHPAGIWRHVLSVMNVTWGHSQIHRAAMHAPCLIALDNYESLLSVDEWLRHYLLDYLPAQNVLLIMAQRSHDGFREWKRDWGLQGRFHPFKLGSLSMNESQRLVQHRNRHAAPEVLTAAGGWPLALVVLTEDCERPREEDHGKSVAWQEHAKAMVDRFWQETREEIECRVVMLLSMVSHAEQRFIEEVLGVELPLAVVVRIVGLSFIAETPLGLSIHDVFWPWVRRDAQRRWGTEYRVMQQEAIRVLDRRWRTANQLDKLRLGRQMLSVIQDMLPVSESYADLRDSFLDISPYRTSDKERLHQLVDQWGWGRQLIPGLDGASPHPLLDDLLRTVPELFRVFRDGDGSPRAFFVPCLLHAPLTRILEHYTGPVSWWIGEDANAYGDVANADTYFGALLGIDNSDAVLPSYLSTGAILRESLSLFAQGTQLFMPLSNPLLIDMAKTVGFELLHSSGPEGLQDIYRLDLRHRSFAEWIMAVAEFQVPSTEPSETDIRYLLRTMQQPNRRAFESRAQIVGWSPEVLRFRLLSLLDSANSTASLSGDHRKILTEVYLTPRASIQALADAYHVSRATCYRLIRRAEQSLLQALQSCEDVISQ